MLCALFGALWAAVRRFSGRELEETLPDDKTAIRACKWPLQRFAIFAPLRPAGHRRKTPPSGRNGPHKRRNVCGEYRDAAAHAGRPGGRKKGRPRKPQGGKLYRAPAGQSRFFGKLPNHHKREKDNKQDNQAGVTSSALCGNSGGSSSGQSYCT